MLIQIALIVCFVIVLITDLCFFSVKVYPQSCLASLVLFGLAYFAFPGLFLFANWHTTLFYYLPAYIGIGIIVAALKWLLYNVKYAIDLRAFKQLFDSKYTGSTDLVSYHRSFIAEFRCHRYEHQSYGSVDLSLENSLVDALALRAKNHVSLLALWIFQWPIVLLDILLTDVLAKFSNHVAKLFDFVFSYVGRKLVARAIKGI